MCKYDRHHTFIKFAHNKKKVMKYQKILGIYGKAIKNTGFKAKKIDL